MTDAYLGAYKRNLQDGHADGEDGDEEGEDGEEAEEAEEEGAERSAHAVRRRQRRRLPPEQICLSYTHDRDYGAFKPHTDRTREHANRPWCPPEQACYDTMGERLLEDEYSYYGGRPRRRSQGMCPAT